MNEIMGQVAKEVGIEEYKANYIFAAICNRIITKVPALEKVIKDVFNDTETGDLEKDISDMVTHLHEQEWKNKFKTWILPQENTEIIKFTGNGNLF
jgi:hypothetical protein